MSKLRHFVFLGLAWSLSACAQPKVAAPRSTSPLRVVSYNIRHGVGLDDVMNLERTAQVLQRLKPDVVLLQEVDQVCGRSGALDQAAWFGDRLGMRAYFAPFMEFDGGQYGLATLVRGEASDVEVLKLPEGRLEPRSALLLTLELRGRNWVVANAHLDWLDDDSQRWLQANALKARLHEVAAAGLPVLLGGDLNDLPDSRTLKLFQEAGPGEGSGFTRLGPEAYTFPSDHPVKTIDHFLVLGNLELPHPTAQVVPEAQASDHRPVMLEWGW